MSLRRRINNELEYKKKSKVFVYPMLDFNLYHISNDTNYLIDINILQRGFPQIILIFDNIDYEPLKSDIYRLQTHHCYVDSEFDDNDKEVCIFLDIPKEYKKDFELFIQGKYSKFSNNYKKVLTRTYGENRASGFSEKTGLPNVSVYDAIYPNDENKKALGKVLHCDWKIIDEVLDPPKIELEEYKTIEELKNIYGDRK